MKKAKNQTDLKVSLSRLKVHHFIFMGIAIGMLFLLGVLTQNVSGDEPAWSYTFGGMAEPVSNNYFAETGWRPLEDWEMNRCAQQLSSDLQKEIGSGGVGFSKASFQYDVGVTLQAIKTETLEGFYYELAWYIQPALDDVSFSISVNNEETKEKREVIELTTIDADTDNSFYHAWVDATNFTHATLDYGEGTLYVEFVLSENE